MGDACDRLAIHPRAAAAVQVAHEPGIILIGQFCMPARDGVLGDDQIAGFVTPDNERVIRRFPFEKKVVPVQEDPGVDVDRCADRFGQLAPNGRQIEFFLLLREEPIGLTKQSGMFTIIYTFGAVFFFEALLFFLAGQLVWLV